MTESSQSEQQADPPDPVTQPLLDFWAGYLKQANQATQSVLDQLDQGDAEPNLLRQQWLDALSRSLDAFMRTPAFLEVMKANLDALIRTKHEADQDGPRQAGSDQDASSLHARLQELEQKILARLDTVCERLQALEQRVHTASREPRRRSGD